MKKLCLLFAVWLFLPTFSICQSLSISTTNEYCPGVDIAGVFSVPGNSSNISISSVSYVAVISMGGVQYDNQNDVTTRSFVIRFGDFSVNQVLRIAYTIGATTQTVDFVFSKIKSISLDRKPQLPSSIQPAPCSTSPVTFTIPTLSWKNDDSQSLFGSISNFQWSIPTGWSVNNSSPSTGPSDFKTTSSANISITPDNIHSGNVLVRVINLCTANLKPGDWTLLNVNRPILSLKQGGASSITINCGETTPRTFEVENAIFYSCINSYEWLVANKGWKDINGNLLTSNVTTTSPSLTLSPVALVATPPQSITVIIKAGTEQINSLVNVSFTNNQPPLTIIGSGIICSSENYELALASNFPSTGSASWQLGWPAGGFITSLPTNWIGGSVTRYGNDTTSLIATLNSVGCGTFPYVYGPIEFGSSGAKGIQNFETDGMVFTGLSEYTFAADLKLFGYADGYEWDVVNGTIISQDGNSVTIITDPATQGTYGQKLFQLNVRVHNSCGWSNWYYRNGYLSWGGGCCDELVAYSVSPNPAVTTTTVSVKSNELGTNQQNKPKKIQQILVINKNSGIVKRFVFGTETTTANLNLIGFAPDIYYLMIYDGNKWFKQTLLKQ